MPIQAPHILILSSWYPTKKNPFLGNFVRRNAQLLSANYRITVINLECSDSISDNEITEIQDGKVTEIKAKYPIGSKLTRFGNRTRIFSQALKELDSVDLIIGHVLLPNGWMFLNASKTLNCPWIWVEHGSYFRTDGKKRWSPRERLLRKSALSKASTIVAVSDFLKADMQKQMATKEILVIGNHVDDQLFTFQPKNPSETTRFLHVSTLDLNTKNPKGILEACSLLAKSKISFQMTIVSDEDASALIMYAEELGISEYVSFVGPQDWSNMPRFFHESDAFVLNSDYETFSIVLAEALSTGTPIISTPVGIANEIPKDAIIEIEKNNPNALFTAMNDFIIGNRTFDHEQLADYGIQYHSAQILSRWTDLIEAYVRKN